MKLVFFRRPKPRQFDYKPRYYDKEKDEREQRKKELGITDSDDHIEQFRSQLRRKWKYDREAKKRKTSDLKTIVYLLIVFLFVYLIFFSDFVHNIVTFFTH